MMDKIMSLIKGQVENAVKDEPSIPEEKKEQTVETTTHTLIDGLKQYATPDNLSSIASMFGLGGAAASASKQSSEASQTAQPTTAASSVDVSPQNNPEAHGLMGGLESNVVSALTSKVGLNKSVAQKIAAGVIPAIMSLFSKKVNDQKEPGFNIGSIINTLSGGGSSEQSSSGGMANMLGGILSKIGSGR